MRDDSDAYIASRYLRDDSDKRLNVPRWRLAGRPDGSRICGSRLPCGRSTSVFAGCASSATYEFISVIFGELRRHSLRPTMRARVLEAKRSEQVGEVLLIVDERHQVRHSIKRDVPALLQ